jgi:serine/threonine-protein kinase
MQAERWQRVEAVFHAALEHAPGERLAYVYETTGGDLELQGEVESLLAAHEANGSLQTAASALAAEWLKGHQPLVGQSLGHFQILAHLGSGGMGEVYLAEDHRLRRKVALKLLPTRLTADAERLRRFEREARAASALNHPNILTIHEIGETDGTHFIVSEFVEGQTLRARMASTRMQLGEALEVATQAAGALAAAHVAGIVHRDIKPENLMLRPDGYVKVLDFGLAKLSERPAPTDPDAPTRAEVKTDPGTVMGTAHYMSPEQARGLEVDARTDIFSLGVVLYEMVAGRVPFEGATASDVSAAILTQEPPPLSGYVPEVPAELERIVSKALAKDREARYQSTAELRAELQRLQRKVEAAGVAVDTEAAPPLRAGEQAAAEEVKPEGAAVVTDREPIRRRSFTRRSWQATVIGLVVLVLAGIIYLKFFRNSPAPPASEIRSLAVLPLGNLSGDPAQEYFADGMTEALISNLARIRALKVISRTSAMRYKGSPKLLPEIARELNVDGVIEGSVQRSGGRVRVTAQLIHAATDTHLWSRDYERDLTDVLKLQGEVARAVADEIRVQVSAEERARLASARRVNPQAHEAYLLGRYHFSKDNEQGWKQAIEYFERAIRLAPDYAPACAGLSEAWFWHGLAGANFKEVESPARAAALKAVGLDEQLAEAHISLGNIKYFYDWDWTGAEQEFKRALELDPGSRDAHVRYGVFLMHWRGRHDEAIREGQIAVQLDPLSSLVQSSLGRFLYRARRYGEALPHLERAVELEPRSVHANFRLGDGYAQLGRYDEAIAAFEKIREVMPKGGDFQAGIARVYALMGRKREARQMISGLKANAYFIAGVYATLGDKDEAFRILEKAVEERQALVILKVEPPLESLHSDPRWQALLRRMNFPPE